MPSLEQACDYGRGGELSAPRLRTDTPERAGLDPGELRHLVKEFRTLTTGERPWAPGAVLVAGRGPVIAVEEASGWAVRYASYDPEADAGVELPPEARVPVRVDTPFDLASLTKLFTAVAAVQQIERGTLGIDARVGAYLPDFTAAVTHGITVRELLTHTSGLRPELPFTTATATRSASTSCAPSRPSASPAPTPTPTSTRFSSSTSSNASPAVPSTSSSTRASPAPSG